MTLHVTEPKKAGHKRRLPMWMAVACVLVAYLIGMIVIVSGFGADQTTTSSHKTPGQYFRAVQWSGHLSVTTQSIAMGIILAGILVGIVGISWRSST